MNNIPWDKINPVIISTIVVILGWIVTHQLTLLRDSANKRREQRVNYLVAAYRALSKASNHPNLYEIADELERAVSDIQFLGNKEQIIEVNKFVESLIKNKTVNLDPLLYAIRKELRKDLGRQTYNGAIMWFKIQKPELIPNSVVEYSKGVQPGANPTLAPGPHGTKEQ